MECMRPVRRPHVLDNGGEAFTTRAGPVAVAERLLRAQRTGAGRIMVTEGHLETIVPLARHAPLAEALELEAPCGVRRPRRSGYSVTLPNRSNIDRVADAFYTDLSGPLTLIEDAQGVAALTLFAGLGNVFDVEPPLAPSASGNGNFILFFDPVGRARKVGLRASF